MERYSSSSSKRCSVGFWINRVAEWDILASRSNYAVQLYCLAFQNVQDVRNHEEEMQYSTDPVLELLTGNYYQCLGCMGLLGVQQ